VKVLLAASEVAPIIKIGGLGDVVGSLPLALAKIGVDVDVIVPFFPYAKIENLKLLKHLELLVDYDEHSYPVTIYKTKLPGSLVDVLLVSSSEFFSDSQSHFFANNMKETTQFAFFSRAVVTYIESSYNTYDIIHCNDWHTSAVPALLKQRLSDDRPATLLTIHNIMYQGLGNLELVKDLGFQPYESQTIYFDLDDNSINMMQQGISSADYVNTVSETYSKEIMGNKFGGGLDELLVGKEGRLTGILNGINYNDFPRHYSSKGWKKSKSELKEALFKRLQVKPPAQPDICPLYSFIGRFDPNQKGIDLIYDTLDFFVEKDCRLVLLGKGDKKWEEIFTELAGSSKYRGLVSPRIVFDVELAKELYEASDFVLIPSKYEPCGLVQMIGMWYGAVPVAHDVGGLKDSIVDGETGYLFDDYSAESLKQVLNRSYTVYTTDRRAHEKMVARCLEQDFSWEKSATKYKDLYEKIVKLREEASN